MRAISRIHKSLGKRFVELRDRLKPSPRDPRLHGIGLVLAGTSIKPHPSADIRFPANLAARARPVAPDGQDEDESDPEAFEREMRRNAYIADPQLKLRIALARKKVGRQAIRLSEVLALFPLKHGLLELNAFIELAVQQVPSRFDPAHVAMTRLVDEHEDPPGRRTCTYFDPIFLPLGEPGAGIESIHCLLPEDDALDGNTWRGLHEGGFRDQVQQLIERLGTRDVTTAHAVHSHRAATKR
jgi:hypothetical protein